MLPCSHCHDLHLPFSSSKLRASKLLPWRVVGGVLTDILVTANAKVTLKKKKEQRIEVIIVRNLDSAEVRLLDLVCKRNVTESRNMS